VIVEIPLVAVVASTPPITPVVRPAVATDVLLLIHVPPPGGSVNVIVEPAHTLSVPSIGPGAAFTVTKAMRVQNVPGWV
jgi:hypothetical protein